MEEVKRAGSAFFEAQVRVKIALNDDNNVAYTEAILRRSIDRYFDFLSVHRLLDA